MSQSDTENAADPAAGLLGAFIIFVIKKRKAELSNISPNFKLYGLP